MALVADEVEAAVVAAASDAVVVDDAIEDVV